MKSWLIWKDPDARKDWRQAEKGTTEDETAGWHHWLDARVFGWTLGVGDGQGCVRWFMGSQRVRHDWVTGLNWAELSLALRPCLTEVANKCSFLLMGVLHTLVLWPWPSVRYREPRGPSEAVISVSFCSSYLGVRLIFQEKSVLTYMSDII